MDKGMDMRLRIQRRTVKPTLKLASGIYSWITTLGSQLNTVGILYSTVPVAYGDFYTKHTDTTSWYTVIQESCIFCHTPSPRCTVLVVVQGHTILYAYSMAMIWNIGHVVTGFSRLYPPIHPYKSDSIVVKKQKSVLLLW
jgi:predicted signal transduction protein with EAL and GGDEF domain